MPKRPPPGRCVHCLNYFDTLTWDHVLPDSWYPYGVYNLEKWEVPACERCNKELGKIEERLLTKLGLCLDPQELCSLGIPDKVLRSLNPLYGKNERDQASRWKKREAVLKETLIFRELPEQQILPNFGPLSSLEYEEYPSVLIEQDDLKKFAEKVVRGIAYIADKSFIEDGYKIELFVIDEDKDLEIRNLVDKHGTIFDRGVAFIVKRLLVENDKVEGIYIVKIWGRFMFYVVVSQKDLKEI